MELKSWVCLHQYFKSDQQCIFEASLLSMPVTTLGLTFQYSLGSCSSLTKLKYRKDSCGAFKVLQSLMGLQSAELVHRQATENKIVLVWLPQQQ